MSTRKDNQRTAARTRKRRARSYRLIGTFIAIILLAVAFAGGFMLRGNSALLQTMGFPSTITGITQSEVTEQTADVYNSLSKRVAEVEGILEKDSLDEYDLDKMTELLLTDLGEASNDHYLRYYTPERYNELLNSQNEGYAGVGVLFSEYAGQAYAVDVFEGAPAQLEGVQEGDFIVSIDADSSQTWSRSEVAAKLSQKQGTSVVITWRRPESLEAEGGEEFTTTLVCEEFDEVNVTYEYDSTRRVGYIKLRQLTQTAAPVVQNAVNDLQTQGAGAIVLDLRDNPGGYLSQAVDVASLFMSSGAVVGVRTVDGVTTKAATGSPVSTLPLVVLVNKNTGAAAEVIAVALKESQRANALVGTNTLGKGSVQVINELSFGGAMRYTAAYYLSPEGHDIDQVGVSPTVTLDASAEGDSQKDYAIELAGSYVTAG